MSLRPRVGVLGGTFDPIHVGHLAVARTTQQALDLNRVLFIPTARPPHRTDSPQASGYHRLEMTRRAIAHEADRSAAWEASDLELGREGPSYSIDTLEALHRDGLRAQQIFFITGADAFAEISTWHCYPAVLDAAHFVVIPRQGTTLASLRENLPVLTSRMIAASEFRDELPPAIILLDTATPDVSATEIRRRARRGESLAGLVPAAVAAYISQESLYRTAPDAPITPVAPFAPGV